MNPAHVEAVKSIKNAVVYKAFLGTAGEMGERFEIDLFAYVLMDMMDNHYKKGVAP